MGEVFNDAADVLSENRPGALYTLCISVLDFRELRSSALPCLTPVPAPRTAKDLQDLLDPL